jgi:RNA polymerase sigma factor (sigma-70 family)
MASRAERSMLHSIQTLFDCGNVSGFPDSQLLEAFLSGRDGIAETAFASLVAVHGPMVWDLCASALRDEHEAEDAFQATFLVLVRRAASIRRRDSIGPWLYGVARRVAARAKATAERHRAAEGKAALMAASPAFDAGEREQILVLHEEVYRLAERYRSPVVLCYLQGCTHSEAARILSCPVGTVSVRLSRARELLRARLSRRGIAFPSAMAGPSIVRLCGKPGPPTGLYESTIEAAMRLLHGKEMRAAIASVSASRLAKGVLRRHMILRVLDAAGAVMVIGVIAATTSTFLFSGRLNGLQAQAPERPSKSPPARENGGDSPSTGISKVAKPSVEFFGVRDRARSVVFAIDRSGSMATRDALEVAKRELLSSIDRLSPETEFEVVFYNLESRLLADARGKRGLMKPTAVNKAGVTKPIQDTQPMGGTDHLVALRAALALKPEVIFFLTDADLMSNGDVDEILPELGSVRIQAIEFGMGAAKKEKPPLARLAATKATGFP